MAIGIMHQVWAETARSDQDVWTQAVADVHLAEDLGFNSFMFGEHHFGRQRSFHGRIPSTEILIGHLAARTSAIRLGTGVKVLSFDITAWRTAELLSLLDLVTEGRSFFCLGQGSPPYIYPAGTSDDERRAQYRERLTDLLGILRGDTVDEYGSSITPAPIRDLTEQIWVAARDDATIRMAGETGLHFVLGQSESAEAHRPRVACYRAAGGRGEVRGVRMVIMAERQEAALEAARPAMEIYYDRFSQGRYFRRAVASGQVPDREPRSLLEACQWMNCCVGSPEAVATQLHDYRRTTSVDRLDIMFHLPGLAPSDVQRSMRLFATEIVPLLDITPAMT